ncbi:hypothetical protein DA01_03580 [Dehalococcoides mccartyi]|uniref:Uncharacterized protein n=1 Tax=Dehalococcoides mccartyi TaxID=61435 RepID=A0A0V8LY22_9CHLR|nr:hypothetical protein [Dehalococcoides mccartyi]KSV16459.1 hypothetical protein DA01_03580 [Dehalococcoides mccartyi]POZ59897.1 hypothetical protein C1O63_0012 [Dehalococcoides mccartyi]
MVTATKPIELSQRRYRQGNYMYCPVKADHNYKCPACGCLVNSGEVGFMRYRIIRDLVTEPIGDVLHACCVEVGK